MPILLPWNYFLFMVASIRRHLLIVWLSLQKVPFSMYLYFNKFHSSSKSWHKKAVSEQQQQQSRFSWLLSALPWHIEHRLLLMKYMTIFLICELPVVYYMYFTVMEHFYSYHKSKNKTGGTIDSTDSLWFSLLCKLSLNGWAITYSYQSYVNPGYHLLPQTT